MENGLQRSFSFDRKLLFYPIVSDEKTEEKSKLHLKLLIDYFKSHVGMHQFYYIKYILCEALGLGITVANIFLINWLLHGNVEGREFLDGEFLNYGTNWLHFLRYGDPKGKEISPVIKLFPLMAKCHPPKRYVLFLQKLFSTFFI